MLHLKFVCSLLRKLWHWYLCIYCFSFFVTWLLNRTAPLYFCWTVHVLCKIFYKIKQCSNNCFAKIFYLDLKMFCKCWWIKSPFLWSRWWYSHLMYGMELRCIKLQSCATSSKSSPPLYFYTNRLCFPTLHFMRFLNAQNSDLLLIIFLAFYSKWNSPVHYELPNDRKQELPQVQAVLKTEDLQKRK